MEWLVDNWYILVGFLALVVAVGVYVYKFFGLPTEKQIENIKEWLKYAVTIAEKELGSGTGQLKLRYVYDLFINKFPAIAKMVTFETFSVWVDEALLWLAKQLAQNPNIQNVINE